MNKKDILFSFTTTDLQLFILLKVMSFVPLQSKQDLVHNY